MMSSYNYRMAKYIWIWENIKKFGADPSSSYGDSVQYIQWNTMREVSYLCDLFPWRHEHFTMVMTHIVARLDHVEDRRGVTVGNWLPGDIHNTSVLSFSDLRTARDIRHPWKKYIISLYIYIHTHTEAEQKSWHFASDIFNVFSLMKLFQFFIKFHRSLFLRGKLIIRQHWFRGCLGPNRWQANILNCITEQFSCQSIRSYVRKWLLANNNFISWWLSEAKNNIGLGQH